MIIIVATNNRDHFKIMYASTNVLVFDQQGRPFRKEFIHWLTDEEKDPVHVINEPINVRNQHLKDLSYDPMSYVVLTLPDLHHMTPVGKGQMGRKNDMWLNYYHLKIVCHHLPHPRLLPSNVPPTPSPPLTDVRPSSSHLDACGLSPIPTSTPSSSLIVANMPINEDVSNLAMEDTPNDRPMITLINGVQRKLVWRPEEENEIKKAFNSKASHRLSKMFRDARNKNKRPYWIGDHVWNNPLSHWNALGYPSKYEEFEARLSQVRSDVASSVGESQLTPLDPAEKQNLGVGVGLQLQTKA
ncbi:hypothetical protein GmHk_04G010260 [Glycine max]|nr:hypothetical protein GmHk_04G010260 [Glycine max]